MTVRIGLTLAVLLAVTWLTSSGARAQQVEDNGRDKKLQTLLTQRHDTLQARLKFVQAMYKSGEMELQQVIDARNAVLDAEIELASTTKRRLELLQERIESLRELESHVQKQQEVGTASVGARLLATAARLQAEIDYEREAAVRNAAPAKQPDPGAARGRVKEADTSSQAQAAKTYPVWAGEWERALDLNRLLGYEADELYTDHYPASFRLSLSKTIGHGVEARLLHGVREVFRRMEHQVVATGKWEIKLDDAPGFSGESEMEISCFVTEHGGSTFLWVPAPWYVVYGGKISFLEGSDRAHDVIVIDFNSMRKHSAKESRTTSTVAYKRRSE